LEHQLLYRTIAAVFERFVPLFDNVLHALKNTADNRVEIDPFNWWGDIDYDDRYDGEPIQPTVPACEGFAWSQAPSTLLGRRVQVCLFLFCFNYQAHVTHFYAAIGHCQVCRHYSYA
jgi:hypothetical protein